MGRHQQGTFRPSWHARASDYRPHRVSRLYPLDELGCDETGTSGRARDQSHDPMRAQHRRRSGQAEAIAPWVALSVVLLLWWAGAQALNWARPGLPGPFASIAPRVDTTVPKAKPVDAVPREAVVAPHDTGPTISPDTAVLGSDIDDLRRRSLLVPVRGLQAE